jgi:alpha-2-macroglobulin
MVADKKTEYKPGETAEILIASPFPGTVQALVTVERANILKQEVIAITGSATYQLPITDVYAPNIYITVQIMRGSGQEGATFTELRTGVLGLDVQVQKRLKITLTPSKAQAAPGDVVTFDVLITDLEGRPVAAEVGLSLSDVATLSVGAANSLPIFDQYWGKRGLGVATSFSGTRLLDSLKPDSIAMAGDMRRQAFADGAPGGGAIAGVPPSSTPGQESAADSAGEKSSGAAANITPRSDFVDTPLWKADLITNSDGKASIDVTLPDNLTTWRLDGRAISAETAVGDATLEIISNLPLLVRPATPRFFVVGDEAELAVVVNNNSGQDLVVDVSLQATGITLRAEPTQTITIKNNDRARVIWLATVQDVPAVDVTFAAVSGEFADASKPAVGVGDGKLLPVYQYQAPDFVGTAGALRQSGNRTEGILLPEEALAPEGELTIGISPSLAAVTLDGLEYLESYPYYCIEQTVSRFLPNVITYRALQQVGLDTPELRANLERVLKVALDKLKAEQKPDGGWGWFYTDGSDPLTTSYALWGLIEARDADLPVDADMINRATAFVQGTLVNAALETQDYILNRQAFVLYVLGRAGSSNVGKLEELYTWRAKMNIDAKAMLAMAYDYARNALGFQDKIDTLLSDIQSAAILSATGAHWEENTRDWWNWGSDTRTTAIVLQAMVRLNPQNELLPNVVRWLMVARRGDAWSTTQETAWSVMALTAWMVSTGELKANYPFTVSLNDAVIGEGTANADTLKETKTLKVNVQDMLRGQLNKLSFTHGEGEGALYYTAHLRVNQPVEAIKATNRGLSFKRTYFIGEDAVTSAKVGDVITVVLEITLNSDLYYVVINDPIPAGTEGIDRNLQTTAQIGQRPELTLDDLRWRGWGWWWFSDTQIRTEKVVLSAQYLPGGTYRFVYQIQATTPGVYRVIPPNGNTFYFPEIFGRGDGSLFTVTE